MYFESDVLKKLKHQLNAIDWGDNKKFDKFKCVFF